MVRHISAVVVLAAAAIAAPPPAIASPNIAGLVVFLDPGHNGANEGNGRQVPTGRGGTKACQTSGTTTASGYPEHTFTWDTTLRIRAALTDRGVRSAMSRGDDASSGPCVDARAAAANAVAPSAIISIHADGGPPAGRGFHVNYSDPPLNGAQKVQAPVLAKTMRDELVGAGLSPAGYIGSGGLYGRADLAGLNLAQYPALLVELGNMRNPQEAAAMESPEGRQRYADAVVAGIVSYLSTLR
ncbi:MULTISPECIES: Rv3717 family N-acetylmuramoyl-L-alanine amidase [Mycolicibacter]|uniref:Rv3717 family N-acetylmuramoyl-L-alanine amidase n=2 Tax=Mycolicibacter TaxID=1073531 RepID=A0ABU5XMJ7_9MYCO|nr:MULTISPECIES: Rv3717 family N-acetylmuramoyl-L-alanine amidase [unclassified Mycolicibacter]MEB3023431.1 Rv3717 family N-acetylmuramoyl-L-alanine amidase [Mycolicibacter sp. MYC098]MEB3033773.1 Rv3717 family N-acetylmuramoyl-L-alanine amidase [Mycolicibacter sp. MYC340]